MNISIVCVGNSLCDYEQRWIDEYTKRSQRFATLTLTRIKEKDGKDSWSALEQKIPEQSWRVLLDPKGKLLTTEQFSQLFTKFERSSKKAMAFVIGGSYGLPERAKGSCDSLISLTPLTLPHRLALLVLTEQIYRVLSYRAGTPYHHA